MGNVELGQGVEQFLTQYLPNVPRGRIVIGREWGYASPVIGVISEENVWVLNKDTLNFEDKKGLDTTRRDLERPNNMAINSIEVGLVVDSLPAKLRELVYYLALVDMSADQDMSIGVLIGFEALWNARWLENLR